MPSNFSFSHGLSRLPLHLIIFLLKLSKNEKIIFFFCQELAVTTDAYHGS
jgi:hypothetical protein